MAVLEQLALQLADLPLATLLCKTFFNLSIGACAPVDCSLQAQQPLLRLTGVRANTTGMDGDADSAVMSLGECEMLQEMVRGRVLLLLPPPLLLLAFHLARTCLHLS